MADREVMLDFGLEEVLKSLSEFGISRALKWEQKGVIATLVTGKHLLAVLPTGFGKSLIFQVLVCVKETMTGTPSSVVVVFPLQSIVCDQMEEASSMGLTAATLTKSRLKDIECGKYNLVFASAEEVLSDFFPYLKTQPHRFIRICVQSLWMIRILWKLVQVKGLFS